MRFAETFLHLIDPDVEKSVALVQIEFDKFEEDFNRIWKINHLAKLGIIKEEDDDEDLLNELFSWMEKEKPDYTNTFRGLLDSYLHADPVYSTSEFIEWKAKWLKRVSSVDMYENLLEDYNPAVIPRNHLVEEALLQASEFGNMIPFNELLKLLQTPYNSCDFGKYQTPSVLYAGYKTFCGT